MAARGSKREPAAPRLPLPADGSIVGVRRVDGPWTWRTRVEWVEDAALCIVAPMGPVGDPVPVEPGEPLLVVWSSDRGLLQASSRLRRVAHDVVELWVVDVAQVERSQRRQAFRLPLVVPVTLRAASREITGETADLSETGLRCRVPATSAPEVADRLEITLVLVDEEPLILDGEVARVQLLERPAPEPAPGTPPPREAELGIAFLELEGSVAEQLRRFVFEEQLRRRSGT